MTTPKWHIAQINVATAKYPTDDPRLHSFMTQLDAVNALAEESPGFVWRLQSDSGNATDIDAGRGPLFLVNMSVWASIEALFEFIYKTAHRDVMIRRREWFEKPNGAYQVLWWIPAGHVPTVDEGLNRLGMLERDGPGPSAFTFQSLVPSPGEARDADKLRSDDHCSGWE